MIAFIIDMQIYFTCGNSNVYSMLCCILHCMSNHKFLVVWGFRFSQLWRNVTMLMFPNVWRSVVPSSSRVEGPHHPKKKKTESSTMALWKPWVLQVILLTSKFISSFLLRNFVCLSKRERDKGTAFSSFVSKRVWQALPNLFVVDRLAFNVVIQANISNSKVTKE